MLDGHTHHSANIPLHNSFTFSSIMLNYRKLLYKITNTGFEFFIPEKPKSVDIFNIAISNISLLFFNQAGHESPSSLHTIEVIANHIRGVGRLKNHFGYWINYFKSKSGPWSQWWTRLAAISLIPVYIETRWMNRSLHTENSTSTLSSSLHYSYKRW